MIFRTSIFTTIISLFLLASCSENTTKTEKQPNILFILVDDLGAHDLSYMGSTYYETPHVDRIANEGMVFTQGYAASRVCSPSRASIMTGQFTARHGITDWIGARTGEAWREQGRHDKLLPAEYNHVLPKEDVSMAEAFQSAGYKTFYSGKWHLGDEGSYPEDHGFDINKGGWEKGSPIGGYFSPWTNPRLENGAPGENLSMRLARETANFIDANKEQPFFAFMSFYAVHGPIQTTQKKWAHYRDKAEAQGIPENGYEMERVLPIRTVQDNPIYAGLVEHMDDAVGLVLDKLDALNLDEKTIVVFTSDNGGVASGDAFSTTNYPLRGGKGYQWEGGIREPFFIKVPWLHLKGKENDVPVIGTDFYPTLLDFAGIELQPTQHIDGLSLKPLLEGGTIDERPLYWHYPHYGNQGGNPSSIIRLGDWKLIHYYEDGSSELYKLDKDPSEQKDIADQYPDKTKELLAQLQSWLQSVNAEMPQADPEYDPILAAERHQKTINVRLPNLEKQRLDFLSKDYDPKNDWWSSDLILE